MAAAVHTAVSAGALLVDTAQNYGSERAIGEGLRRLGSGGTGTTGTFDVFLLAKVDLCSRECEDPRARMRRQVGSSLGNLGVEQLDAVAFHWPFCLDRPLSEEESRTVRKESYEELESMMDEGLIRSIGLSNFSVELMDEIIAFARYPPVLNEIEFSPVCHQVGMRRACEERGIRIVAYSPYGRCWLAKYFPGFVPWGAESLLEVEAVEAVEAVDGKDKGKGKGKGKGEVVAQISRETGLTPAQVLLSWCMQKGVTPIPMSLIPEQVRETAELLRSGDGDEFRLLCDAQMAALDGLNDPRRGVEASIEAHSRIIEDPNYVWDMT